MLEVTEVTSTTEEAKDEMAVVLSSATFARTPRLARLLKYLCTQYFAGKSDQIKEYNIAIDLLGRPESFDPAADAIARVEVHRLRKKLKEYYEAEGSTRDIHIVIPTGCYVPSFVRLGPITQAPQASTVETPVLTETPSLLPVPDVIPSSPEQLSPFNPPPAADRRFNRIAAIVAGSFVLVAILFTVRVHPAIDASPVTAVPASLAGSVVPAGLPQGQEVAIVPGRTKPYTDRVGRTWQGDRYFTGGEPFQRTLKYLARTNDPGLFESGRVGNFNYDIPLSPGSYELHLYFAETEFGPGTAKGGGENSRVFHVTANGVRILSEFDLIADTEGPNIADERVFKDIAPGSDGRLHLRFFSSRGDAMISAIELEPAHPHHLNPIRISARSQAFTGSDGKKWRADNYWIGGQSVSNHEAVQGASDSNLYAMERYGHFDYSIPVAPGIYRAAVHLAESYWGPENSGGGGVGNRVFDIFCNGAALVRSVDVYREVGANHPLVLRYANLKPNAQGKLDFSFVPVANYASLYALEIEDSAE